MVSHEDDPDYVIPLQDKKPFGAGISRKPVQFVRAKSPELTTSQQAAQANPPTKSIADIYLNIVLPSRPKEEAHEADEKLPPPCSICHLPIRRPESETDNDPNSRPHKHEATLAHQVCLTHSHPPSAVERSRMGLAYLESFGWDPDSRKGLGAAEQGIAFPLKAKPKNDTVGLGIEVPKDIAQRVSKRKQKAKTLDAKQCRKAYEDDKKKHARLQEMFYGSDDVLRYLGR